MAHTKELSRQLYGSASHVNGWDSLQELRGQVSIRFHKKQRRRYVRRWNHRETIRQYDWYQDDLWQEEQDDIARMAEYEREYFETQWFRDEEAREREHERLLEQEWQEFLAYEDFYCGCLSDAERE